MTVHWIFTHGSLMARPPFDVRERAPGQLDGWRRTFGHPSVRNWGRHGHAAPTCSLVAGGSVAGVAYRVDTEVVQLVRAREASEPVCVVARIPGARVDALTWPMTSTWSHWSPGRLAEAARVNVTSGGGPLGDALDYVAIVSASLREHGLVDPLVAAYRDALSKLGLPAPVDTPSADVVPMGGPVQ